MFFFVILLRVLKLAIFERIGIGNILSGVFYLVNFKGKRFFFFIEFKGRRNYGNNI